MTAKEEENWWRSRYKRVAKELTTHQMQVIINRLEFLHSLNDQVWNNFPDYRIRLEVYKEEIINRILLTEGNDEN